jgi:hypothetical protein
MQSRRDDHRSAAMGSCENTDVGTLALSAATPYMKLAINPSDPTLYVPALFIFPRRSLVLLDHISCVLFTSRSWYRDSVLNPSKQQIYNQAKSSWISHR